MSGLPYKREVEAKPRPDYHRKTAKLVRATDEQWSAWQREANRSTGGNLNAYMVEACDRDVTMPGARKKKAGRVR